MNGYVQKDENGFFIYAGKRFRIRNGQRICIYQKGGLAADSTTWPSELLKDEADFSSEDFADHACQRLGRSGVAFFHADLE